MDRVDDNTYACTLCNIAIRVDSDERPVTVIVAQSGQPNMRVVTVGDVEVHRCVLADNPHSVRVGRS